MLIILGLVLLIVLGWAVSRMDNMFDAFGFMIAVLSGAVLFFCCNRIANFILWDEI